MEKPSNIVINLHRKIFSIITNIPLIISLLIVTIIVTINSLEDDRAITQRPNAAAAPRMTL